MVKNEYASGRLLSAPWVFFIVFNSGQWLVADMGDLSEEGGHLMNCYHLHRLLVNHGDRLLMTAHAGCDVCSTRMGSHVCLICNVAAMYVRWQYSNFNRIIGNIKNRVRLRLTNDILGPYIEIRVCKGCTCEA